MTAAKLQALAKEAHEATQYAQGMAEQARLRGLTTETFGLLDCDVHLIQKLRVMDPALRETITGRAA